MEQQLSTADASPKVSVVMSVYNGAPFLRQAVESILAQTFEDFEFIIIDDGSTDNTARILKEFSDPRIRIIENSRNEGLTRSLIKGCALARGKYIARMDADEVSYPTRFDRQVEFLETHPDYAVVGTQCRYIDSKGTVRATSDYLCSDEEIKQDVWRRTPFAHASTMFVRERIEECGGYRELFRYSQDCDLWLRVVGAHKVANLPESLHCLRYHRGSITLKKLYYQARYAELAREFARMRKKTGADPIMSGDMDEVDAAIERWRPAGLFQSMRIRSDSALHLAEFMVPWGGLGDVFILWVTALCSNPMNAEIWRFLFGDQLRLRLKTAVKNRL